MASVEERLAYLEGRVEDHSQMVNGIREALASLETRMDRRFEQIDRRFEQIDRRFEQVDQRFDALDAKMSRQFVWLVGAVVTVALTTAGGFAAIASSFASLAATLASR
jgi:hypothetical protein